MIALKKFKEDSFMQALKTFFHDLHVQVNYITDEPANATAILGDKYKDKDPAHELIDEVYVLGIVDDTIFEGQNQSSNEEWTSDRLQKIDKDYDGLVIIGVTLKQQEGDLLPTRNQLAEITRAFNRTFPYMPVTIVFKYGNYIAFANGERAKYKQEWREGEKVGKVTMLKDVSIVKTHAAHEKILTGLTIDNHKINSFQQLYAYWQTVFSLQALNDQFYADLQSWFYYAAQNIKLPFKPDYINEKENTKNFLVRLMARTMFCWFVKEKGLIKNVLLELADWNGKKYPLTNDIDSEEFLHSNSYYCGVLQNVFFNALNKKDKSSLKDFEWKKYLNDNFDIKWFSDIPFLNGGIFDRLDEDNHQESYDETIFRVPNFLFYGISTAQQVTKGKGDKTKTEIKKVEHKGLNGIFKSYKFTLEENTPFEENIALDPELLGLVFENLLAELDPNLEENTIKSIRKLTGSYYTPRKAIHEMVNDSLFLYLLKYIKNNYPQMHNVKKGLVSLVYHNVLDNAQSDFCDAVVNGLDKFKMLDPACGSGAFPMGMLHRMVEILKLVDPYNQLWLELKLEKVNSVQRDEFKKILTQHLDDYSRKLGIIRDSIYGIDIQPLAVQITKLRFFISLLIDQRTEKGITPMPNIETKIICADSLKNIEADLFSCNAIERLQKARVKYYQPDISLDERAEITDEIIEVLDKAFPSFAEQVTGKRISGQNKTLLKGWFTHATIAAPFFNMDFFFPELKEVGGFDCVIGNPPYGGTKISDEVRKLLGIESKDPYGAFIARFLNAADKPTPLKHDGVLAFIVSDTFMTIKSHLPLRRMMMQNYIHKMLRMHPDTFRATVNTVIMICERNVYPKDKDGKYMPTFNENHICQMADLTNISIHDNYDHFVEVLNQTKGVNFDQADARKAVSNAEYAIYYYPQSQIVTNSNLPFFVASPKLFVLMNDSGKNLKKQMQEIAGKSMQVRALEMNGKPLKVIKLGDIGETKQGLKTGDNDSYILQNPTADGNYKNVNDYRDFVLSEKDVERIQTDRDLRLSIIQNGINTMNKSNRRYFNGKYILPIDKGGESDSDDGYIPNFFVKTDYYIDWSEWSVARMKTLTTKERNKEQGKQGGDHRVCSRFQNVLYSFKDGITYSPTGIYSPSFRLNSQSIFESKGSTYFLNSNSVSIKNVLGYVCSKLVRYVAKSYVSHTVETGEKAIEEITIPLEVLTNSKISECVETVIQNQKTNPRYDYASHEQIEIDRLVYEVYGMNAEDIEEVENWYARRYPKLSAAQKVNLRRLGKSDDYLALYGLKRTA